MGLGPFPPLLPCLDRCSQKGVGRGAAERGGQRADCLGWGVPGKGDWRLPQGSVQNSGWESTGRRVRAAPSGRARPRPPRPAGCNLPAEPISPRLPERLRAALGVAGARGRRGPLDRAEAALAARVVGADVRLFWHLEGSEGEAPHLHLGPSPSFPGAADRVGLGSSRPRSQPSRLVLPLGAVAAGPQGSLLAERTHWCHQGAWDQGQQEGEKPQ